MTKKSKPGAAQYGARKAGRPRAVREASPARSVRVRKNMRLDQKLLDEARRALGAADETEAVTMALTMVVDRIENNRRVMEGLRSIAGTMILDESRIND